MLREAIVSPNPDDMHLLAIDGIEMTEIVLVALRVCKDKICQSHCEPLDSIE
jgi:hypothetical protein